MKFYFRDDTLGESVSIVNNKQIKKKVLKRGGEGHTKWCQKVVV